MKSYKYPHPYKLGVMVSRQRIKQLRYQAQGLCITCGTKSVNALYCAKHTKLRAINLRNKFRKLHGIPFSKPGTVYK